MTLLQHGTVKFTDTDVDNTDGLLTLARSKDPQSLPVYFCSSPFLLENQIVRDIIDNAATLKPQATSALISEQANALQPDLMLSMHAYCVGNDDVITLASIETLSGSEIPALSEITLLAGSRELLQQCLATITADDHKTIIYFPTNIEDQLQLNALLELDINPAVIPVICTGSQSFSENQPKATALICAIDLAIACDASFFHWIEGNASHLAAHNSDVLSQLLMQYAVCASENKKALLTDDTQVLNTINELANNSISSSDVAAILLMIKTQVSVLNGLLPIGADARVWQLLTTLGHTLYFDELAQHTSTTAKQLYAQTQSVLLNSIGELSPAQTLEPSDIEAAMQWLQEQHQLNVT